MAIQHARKLFTVDEYHKMAEAGILSEDDHVELIEGEIINISPINSVHAACVKRLRKLFTKLLGDAVELGIQDPILIAGSEPEPDISLLKPSVDLYATAHPTPADILLLVEVSNSSFADDIVRKVPLYARNGIVEVWVVDVQGETVEVYSQPENGTYQLARQIRRGESVSIHGFPDVILSVNDILG